MLRKRKRIRIKRNIWNPDRVSYVKKSLTFPT
jgi:hypothetical protein